VKEIIAILRPKQVGATKQALVAAGFPALTAQSVRGRGKQAGLVTEVECQLRAQQCPAHGPHRMPYVPKRLLTVMVPDDAVDAVVRTIMAMNRTGCVGDGRIFICPLDDAVRIRTTEAGDTALR